jgi:site-specific DNA-methyltransferase (adenine-specific)
LKGKEWKLREEIIWNKVTAGRNGVGNRFGSTIKNPYPGYYHANIMHEHILVFSKGETDLKRRKEKSLERVQKLRIDELMKRDIANSTWHIAPVPPGNITHPCPFPEQIPWRLIQLYTYVNDVVLDPFNGSGQTTKVAKHLGRHYIGVDIFEDYVKLAKKRLNEPLNLSTLLYVKRGGWGSKGMSKWQLKEQTKLSV